MSNDFWLIPSPAPVFPGYNMVLAGLALVTALQNPLSSVLGTNLKMLGGSFVFANATGAIGVDIYQAASGTVSGNMLPEDVSVVVQKDTGTLGKAAIGRWYFSGVPQSSTNGSYLTPTGESNWVTALLPWLSPISDTTGISWQMAHFDRKTDTLLPITGMQAIQMLGTRRRRRFRF